MLIQGRSRLSLGGLMVGATLAITGAAMVGVSLASEKQASVGRISCPNVANKLPSVPSSAQAEVTRNLTLLQTQINEANDRLVSSQGNGDPNFVKNAILGPLASNRTATIDRIAIAIGRSAPRPALDLPALSTCVVVTGNNAAKAAAPTARATQAPERAAAAKTSAAPVKSAAPTSVPAAVAPVQPPAVTSKPPAVATQAAPAQASPELRPVSHNIGYRWVAAAVAIGSVLAASGWMRRLPPRSPLSRNVTRVLLTIAAIAAIDTAFTPPPWAALLALVAAGLAAMSAHVRVRTAPSAGADGHDGNDHEYTFPSLGQLGAALAGADPVTRLTHRTHPGLTQTINGIGLVLQVAIARNLAKVLTRDLARSRDRDQTLAADLTRALDLARDLAKPLSRDLALDLEYVRDLADALARPVARPREREVDLSLARDLALDLGRDLSSAIEIVCDLGRDLAYVRDVDLARDLARARTRGRALAVDLSALQRQRDDFTHADLSAADLTGIDLDGVLWSRTGTQWPTDWEAKVAEDSVEAVPGTGVFEIHRGHRHAQVDLAAAG
jgi:hypothetical protein